MFSKIFQDEKVDLVGTFKQLVTFCFVFLLDIKPENVKQFDVVPLPN